MSAIEYQVVAALPAFQPQDYTLLFALYSNQTLLVSGSAHSAGHQDIVDRLVVKGLAFVDFKGRLGLTPKGTALVETALVTFGRLNL